MKLILLTLLSFSILFAKVNSGDTLPALALVDQFDNKVKVLEDSTLIISFQKSVSSEIQAYLDTKPKDFLAQNRLLYISDMSAAPKFMIKLFGIPKMKKFAYKVALIYDEKIADMLQREEEKVTIITLRHHTIIKIQFVSPKNLELHLTQKYPRLIHQD